MAWYKLSWEKHDCYKLESVYYPSFVLDVDKYFLINYLTVTEHYLAEVRKTCKKDKSDYEVAQWPPPIEIEELLLEYKLEKLCKFDKG
jgi:hypothetical protein